MGQDIGPVRPAPESQHGRVAWLRAKADSTGRFFLGRFAASRIGQLSLELPDWNLATTTLRQAAALLQANSDPAQSPSDLSQAARTMVRDYPLYACLIPNFHRTGPLGGDGLRALMLLDALDPERAHASHADYEDAHPFVKQWDERGLIAERDAVLAFVRAPSVASRISAKKAIRRAEEALGRKPGRHADTLLGRVFDLLVQAWRERPPPRVPPGTSMGLPPLEGCHGLIRADSSEEGRGGHLFLLDAGSTVEEYKYRRRTGQHSGFLFESSLMPGSNRFTDLRETACVIEKVKPLLPAFADADANGVAATLVSVAVVSSVGFKDGYDEVMAARRGEATVFTKIDGFWCVLRPVPGARRHAHDTLPPDLRSLASPVYIYALPQELQAPFEILIQTSAEIPAWPACSEALALLMKSLRDDVSPRVAEVRLRLAVAAACFWKDQNPATAMILAGDDFTQSQAPIGYYAPKQLGVDLIREGLWHEIGLQPMGPPVDDSILLGASIAAIPDSVIRAAIKELNDRLKLAWSTGDVLAQHNALVVHLTWLWLACTGHRGHGTIGALTTKDIDPRGWAVHVDKPDFSDEGPRLCLLSGLVLDVACALIHFRRKSLDRLPPASRSQLEASIVGDAPLLLLVAVDGTTRAVASEDLQPANGLPRHVFRSRLRMSLARRGVWPRLIYALLGHVWNGQEAFGRDSIHSIAELQTLLQGHIDAVLEQDGWAFPEFLERASLADWPKQQAREAFERQWKTYAKTLREQWAERGRATHSRFSAEERVEHDRWVDEMLTDLIPTYSRESPPGNVQVSAEQVRRWVTFARARFKDLNRIEMCLQKLHKRLLVLRSQHGWTGDMSPLAIPPKPVEPPITTYHLRAAAAAHNIRQYVATKDSLDGRLDSDARWARLSIVLILDHAVANTSQLLSCLANISAGKLLDHPHDERCVLTELLAVRGREEIPADDSPQARHYARSARLSPIATLLARSLVGARVPSQEQLVKLMQWALRKAVGGSNLYAPGFLFSMSRMSARIDLPGANWIWVEREDQGTLSLERTSDFVRNDVGARHARDDEPQGPSNTSPFAAFRVAPERERYDEYKRFRSGLWKLAEPGAGTRHVPSRRYKRARDLCKQTAASETTDVVVAMLAMFVHELLHPAANIRVKSAYGVLVSFGRRLLLALGERNILDLDEISLMDVYVDAMKQAFKGRQKDVAFNLMRFHRFHAALLPSVDIVDLLSRIEACGHSGPVFPQLVTDAEYRAMRDMLSAWEAEGHRSPAEVLERKVFLAFLYRKPVRPGEITHMRSRDVSGSERAYVTNNALGLVKTPRSVRPLDLGTSFADAEKCEIGTLRATRAARSDTEGFLAVRPPDSLGSLLEDVRDLLRAVTGNPAADIYSFRHSRFSVGVFEIMQRARESGTDPMMDLMALAAEGGHVDTGTKRIHYSHLEHLLPHPHVESLTSAQVGLLSGCSGATVRQRAKRRRGLASSMEDESEVPTSPEAVAFVLGSRPPPVDGTLRFLAALHAGDTPQRAATRCRLSRDQLQRALLSLDRVGRSYRFTVFGPEVAASLVSIGVSLEGRASNTRRLTVAKRYLLRIINTPSPFDVRQQAGDLLTGLHQPREDWSTREQQAFDEVQRVLGFGPSTDLAAMVAACVVACSMT